MPAGWRPVMEKTFPVPAGTPNGLIHERRRRNRIARSFLVSGYGADANAGQAKAWLIRTGAPLIFTSLHTLEVRNAFELGVFRGHFTATEARAAAKDLAEDLRGFRLVETSLNWSAAFRLAARLSEQHSATVGSRSLQHCACRRGETSACEGVRFVRWTAADARGCGGFDRRILNRLTVC